MAMPAPGWPLSRERVAVILAAQLDARHVLQQHREPSGWVLRMMLRNCSGV
jgi:hypothetical protein